MTMSFGEPQPAFPREEREQVPPLVSELDNARIENERLRDELTRTQALSRQFLDQLERYKTKVREVAIRVADEQSWCDQGLNDVLEELGLEPNLHTYRVTVRVVLHQEVTVEIQAGNREDVEQLVDEDTLRDELDYERDSFDIHDWSASQVREV